MRNISQLCFNLRNMPAISLTFDDALAEHLDHAIPILADHGLKGTFYVHLSADGFLRRIDDWRAAAQLGHELGNHTIFHPADARKPWVREGNAIDGYTLDRMRQELQAASLLLRAIDGSARRTFAYPCSNPILGHRGWVKQALFWLGWERTRVPGWVDRLGLDFGSTEQSYTPVVADLFLAARGGGLQKDSTAPPVSKIDRFLLPSVAVEGWSLADLIAFTRRGVENGAWVILQFHGIGGGHRMDCDLATFRDFTSWLANQHADSVATVREHASKVWSDLLQPATDPDSLTPAMLAR
jgi:sialate O-acetylesterase